ncbi:hypothetical protein WA158_005272 [Blastocystis sp. Blastoise]
MPERPVYALGFTVGGICYFIAILYVYKHAYEPLNMTTITPFNRFLRVAQVFGALCPFFLAIQAILPLQSDIFDVQDGKGLLNAQSMIHQGSAVILFVLAIIHSYLVCHVLWKNPNNLLYHYSRYIKSTALFFMALSFILSIGLHPASQFFGDNKMVTNNIGGISQWIFVFSMIFFFGSYSADFYHARDFEVHNE